MEGKNKNLKYEGHMEKHKEKNVMLNNTVADMEDWIKKSEQNVKEQRDKKD